MVFERVTVPLEFCFVKLASPSMVPVMFVMSEPSVTSMIVILSPALA